MSILAGRGEEASVLGLTATLFSPHTQNVLVELVRRELLRVSPDGALYRALTPARRKAWLELRRGRFHNLDAPPGSEGLFFGGEDIIFPEDKKAAAAAKEQAEREAAAAAAAAKSEAGGGSDTHRLPGANMVEDQLQRASVSHAMVKEIPVLISGRKKIHSHF